MQPEIKTILDLLALFVIAVGIVTLFVNTLALNDSLPQRKPEFRRGTKQLIATSIVAMVALVVMLFVVVRHMEQVLL